MRKQSISADQIGSRNAGKVEDWVESGNPTGFVTTNWGNVQIDPEKVKPGQLILVAEKEEVLVGSSRFRMIAPWRTHTVVSPDMCTSDGMQHCFTICPDCLESWLWDHLIRDVRTLRNFAHGTNRAYDTFGCRCDACRLAHSGYLNGTLNADGTPTHTQAPAAPIDPLARISQAFTDLPPGTHKHISEIK